MAIACSIGLRGRSAVLTHLDGREKARSEIHDVPRYGVWEMLVTAALLCYAAGSAAG